MPAKISLKDRISNFNIEKYGPFVALAVLLLVMLVLQPQFFKINNVVNVLKQVSYMGCIAVGMTFVIITGGIDLSVGSMAAMTGGLMLVTTNHFNGSIPSIILALVAGCALAVGCGWAVGTLTTRGRIAPFIVTLGTGAIYRSIVLQAANGGEFRGATETYPVIGQGSFLGIPYAIFVFLAFAIVCHIILNNTRLGRYMYAVGSNEDVARYSAIKTDRIKIIAYMILGFGVFLMALMFSSRINAVSSSNFGAGLELDAIAAVVIGGTSMKGGRGWIWGTVVGVIILGVVGSMLNWLNVSAYLQGAVKGLVIIAAVLVQRGRGEAK
jgi:ribose transport system permease protein